MSEQIKRIESNIMRAMELMELIEKDDVALTYNNGDFFMKYLEKAGQSNEDLLFLKEEEKKPIGEHTSFITKSYAQFSTFYTDIFTSANELQGIAEKFVFDMKQDILEAERHAIESTIPQIMSRFGYSREKATAIVKESMREPKAQALLDERFEMQVSALENLDEIVSGCIMVDYSTRSFSCESEAVFRNTYNYILKSREFEFEKMSPSQLNETEKEFLIKVYELSKDLNFEIVKIKKFLPEIVENKLNDKKKELEELENELEKERTRFKEETQKASEEAKKELAEIEARIDNSPSVPGFTWLINMFGAGKKKQLLNKKSELEKIANPKENDFGKIKKLKSMIKRTKTAIEELEEEIKSSK